MPRLSPALTVGLVVVVLTSLGRCGARAQARAGSPSYVQSQWTAEDGLPVNSVNDIGQTSDGYLWLATYDGLARFDGAAFRVYRSGRYDGLPSNRIVRLLVRPDGVWMRTESRHVVRFQEGAFTTVATDVDLLYEGTGGTLWAGSDDGARAYRNGEFERVATGDVSGLLIEPDGTLWMATADQRLYRRSPGEHPEKVATLDGDIRDLARGRGGRIWVGTEAGLYRWDDRQLAPIPAADAQPEAVAVTKVAPNVGGTCLVSTTEGLFRCRADRLVPVVRTPISPSTAGTGMAGRTVAEVGPDGAVWTRAETSVYREETLILDAEAAVTDLLADRQGNVWVGTAANGLFRLRRSPFVLYGEPEGLASGNIYPIVQRRDGSVWLGTLGGGVGRVGPSGSVTTYRPSKNGTRLDNVWALHVDRAGRLWMSGANGRLCRFSGGGCARPDTRSPIRGRVRALHEDRRGRLWAGSEDRGLYRCDSGCLEGPTAWTQFVPEDASLPASSLRRVESPTASRLPDTYVRTIHETPGGAIWIGTNGGGVARYADGAFEPLTVEEGLSSNLVRDIYQDTTTTGNPDVLWVVTEDQGLNRVALSRSDTALAASVTTYRRQDGLFDNALHQMMKDDQGRFWFSSNRGLFWVREADLEAFARGEIGEVRSVSYTAQQGLRSSEANGGVQSAGMKAADGRLWVPTQAGAAVIDPSTIPVSMPPPPVHAEAVTSNDSVVARRPATGLLRLTADQRDFSVEYTGIWLANPEAVSFRYRLKGLETDWRKAGHRRQAFFTNVPPGPYTFEVSARGRGGRWSTPPARVAITVAPYFYETWWFYGLCVVLAGLAVVGGVRYWLYTLRRRKERLRRQVKERTEALAAAKNEAEQAKEQTEEALATVEEQARQLRELDEMKSRFFANISHELRTPLSLMLGPIQQMLKREGRPDEEQEALEIAYRNAKRMKRLVEQLLDLARHDAGRLSLNTTRAEWAGFVERVTQRFVPMAERKEVALSVSIQDGAAPVVFDPDHMETVIANLVRNALAHTPSGGRVTVTAAVDEDTASLIVDDTGPGIPEAKQEMLFERFHRGPGQTQQGGTGIGLSLAETLMALHEGTIEVESEPGAGSRFVAEWPAALPTDASARPDEPALSLPDTDLSPSGRGDGEAGSAMFDSASSPNGPSPPDGSETESLVDRTTVLVVDDNADVRRYVRSLLEPRYQVTEARDGEQGLERARADLPDLIVADVMMPERDGFSMVRALRLSPRTDSIPVVMLTARAEEADQVEGLTGGAEAYVTKPFSPDVLTSQIDRLIASYRQLRQRIEEENPTSPPPEATATDSPPDSFEARTRKIVSDRLTDPDFSVGELAEAVGLTERAVRRKTKEAFGRTPSALIRTTRLERGAELLVKTSKTVSEVAYAVGFNSLSYFSSSFKDHFGLPPSTYQKKST